jgi:hypothetical protein
MGNQDTKSAMPKGVKMLHKLNVSGRPRANVAASTSTGAATTVPMKPIPSTSRLANSFHSV